MSSRGPLPLLIYCEGQSYKQSILFGTISYNLVVHADQRRAPHIFILWVEPPLMVRPYRSIRIQVYTPQSAPAMLCKCNRSSVDHRFSRPRPADEAPPHKSAMASPFILPPVACSPELGTDTPRMSHTVPVSPSTALAYNLTCKPA